MKNKGKFDAIGSAIKFLRLTIEAMPFMSSSARQKSRKHNQGICCIFGLVKKY